MKISFDCTSLQDETYSVPVKFFCRFHEGAKIGVEVSEGDARGTEKGVSIKPNQNQSPFNTENSRLECDGVSGNPIIKSRDLKDPIMEKK